ncbi:MAG TPA: TonB-dependent receptor [Terriglobia bacterium]|nr:TonB-dependent receptor [Terriglobia bacterium]
MNFRQTTSRNYFFCGSLTLIFSILFAGSCLAQFNSNVQGVVGDQTGAPVPGAAVRLVNLGTQVALTTTTDAGGNYHFVSLAPGSYEVSAEKSGFSKATVTMTLQTGQTLNLPLQLAVASLSQKVEVTTRAPVLNTAETRNQLTIQTEALTTLPLAGRSMISLVTLAPGAVGLGVNGGSPGSGVDNFSTETQVDVSANGQGGVGNMYVVDGLDVTSSIRPGVLNLTPDPDSIQEASIETNTFNVDYGRASSIEMLMTTKSGTDQFHGSASDYFTYQKFFAGTEFVHNYSPFHSNNMSGAIGGPVIPHHQLFFFFSIEPLRSSASTGNSTTTFEDPAFTAWAQQNYPNTLGTKLLTTYKPSSATVTGVSETAQDIFPGTCGTAATDNLPCNLPMVDNGVFNSSNFRNGTQWNVRIDKYFKNDRIYGNFYRTTLNYGGGALRPQFITTNNTYQRALQINETHTFSAATLNEAVFGVNRIEGLTPNTGLFSIPLVNVTGVGTGFGSGFAHGDFIQHNYHWRDVLTNIRGPHTLRFGYEGWFGDDVEDFQGPHAQPTFQFNNLLELVQDNPYNESGVSYNPLTGQFVPWDWNAASKTWGLFAEDTWKVGKTLTLNYGVRYDDYGNPYSRDPNTVFGNFFYGPGQTTDQQIANGIVVSSKNALSHSVDTIFSPRGGFAWNIKGNNAWVLRGGLGIFHNWPTNANVQEEFRGNPPGPIYPTFFSGTATPPLFALGTSNTYPFGYTYPTFPAGQLDAHGGVVGLNAPIGAINPNLLSPVAYIVAATLERRLSNNVVASVGYSGSHADDLLSGGNQLTAVSYGVDINEFPGDLIVNNSSVPTRLNHSFGQIYYTTNNRVSNYNGLIVAMRGRFGRKFIDASYTRSSSQDDAGVYPTPDDPHQYYGPSNWDAPNRFSLAGTYELPGINQGRGLAGHITGGWMLSGTSIYQTGYPFTVANYAPFLPLKNSAGQIIGFAPGSGDYLANGDNFSYPNVASYTENTSRSAFLNGTIFSPGEFTTPALATNGNEKPGLFREPSFAETDLALVKNTKLGERVNLELRFEFYNIFNTPNLNGVDLGLTDAAFGRATGQSLPRWVQFGAKLSF